MDYREALDLVIDPGLRLLPERMNTHEARVMMLAIGMQESRFSHRRQISGPARGFFQFEKGGGVAGVLAHASTKRIIDPILKKLHIEGRNCYEAIVYNDALASVFCRLLLWTHPKALPSLSSEPGESWQYYLDTWRPGKPHRHTWDGFLLEAREAVGADRYAE